MPLSVEIDPRSIAEIEELRDRHRRAFRALRSDEPGTPAERMIFHIIDRAGDVWEATAPRLTGTLALATRERLFDGVGRIFIDPTIENPVYGGLPVIYGPAVHQRKPWVDELARGDLPRIVFDSTEEFLDEFGDIYRR